jgi:hypothetical protein
MLTPLLLLLPTRTATAIQSLALPQLGQQVRCSIRHVTVLDKFSVAIHSHITAYSSSKLLS